MAERDVTGDEPVSYGDALAELDRILSGLESDEVDVDHLGAQVRRAAELVALCRRRILAARLEVTQVTGELEGGPDAPPSA